MSALPYLLGAAMALGLAFPVAAEEPASLQAQGTGAAGFARYAGPVTVETALQVGLEQSLQVAMAKSQLEQARAGVAEAQSALCPQISLNAFAMRNSIPMIYQTTPGVMPAFTQLYPEPGALSANAVLMYPLFTGGALEHQLQATESAERAALARTAFSLREAARSIRSAYFQIQQTRANMATLNWQLTQAREMEAIAERQLSVGKVAPYVRLRAQTQVADTQQKLNEANAELARREAELKLAMSVAVDSDFEYPELEEPPAAPAASGELTSAALRDRPDLVAARYVVEEGDRLLAAALSEYSPKAYLVGMAESTRVAPFSSSGRTDAGYSVGLVFSFSVFDGGMRESREDRARASLDERRLQVRQLELQATSQVVAARAQLVGALDNLALSQTALRDAREGWRIARLRLEVGRAIYVEILDALLDLARARNNEAQALYAARIAEADLLYATGRY